MNCPMCGTEMVIDSWNGWVWTCFNFKCGYVGRQATYEEYDKQEKEIEKYYYKLRKEFEK